MTRMVARKHLLLPDGYWARQIDGVWYLFDHRNVMLAGPADAATVEGHAWRDVWHRLEEDLDDELAALRAGTSPLHDLHRLRQYFRLVDAVERVEARSERPHTRTGLGHWRLSTIAAAAVAAAFVIGLMGIERGLEGPTPLSMPSRRAIQTSAMLPQRLGSAETPGVPEVVRSTPGVHVPAPPPRQPAARYAVSVGTFANPTSADRMKHLVRSKGYVVDVVPRGGVSQVVTPPLRTHAQAECVVRGLAGLGLPAQLWARRIP